MSKNTTMKFKKW